MKKIVSCLLFFTVSALCFAFPDFSFSLPGEDYSVIFDNNVCYEESISPDNIEFLISEDNSIIDEEGFVLGAVSFADEQDYRVLRLSSPDSIQVYYINLHTWFVEKTIEVSPYRKYICFFDSNGECFHRENFIYNDSKIEDQFGSVLQEDYPSEYLIDYSFFEKKVDSEERIYVFYPEEGNPETTEYYSLYSTEGEILSQEKKVNGILEYKRVYDSSSDYKQYTYDSQGNQIYVKKIKDYKTVERSDGVTTWTYPELTDDLFYFDDSHYMLLSYTSTEIFEEYVEISKTDYVDWNEYYFAEVTPYSLVKKSEMYLYLKTFISKNYLVEGSYVYYGKGDSYLYVIPVTDDCIDLDKPGYRVKLVEKPEF